MILFFEDIKEYLLECNKNKIIKLYIKEYEGLNKKFKLIEEAWNIEELNSLRIETKIKLEKIINKKGMKL